MGSNWNRRWNFNIQYFNTEGDYKAKLAYRIKDESGEKVKIRNPVFKMEWGSIT